ncbi:flagellar basal body L-ring protein FlgH [Alkalimonas collagenimarina]|uniref:Flagellar L-ring protein n=1 Tax=Alkalimonas collagenimarina TaxID=400390 RepID=A0ABT9GXT9_9GAMM|nr:flagellar basal body L-ring protein FlgH [Alkalimonas collagenimarina]MDP4535881.1 flagellar basal body L-ring protein FlgH [Alkalimonas collagenimarina]
MRIFITILAWVSLVGCSSVQPPLPDDPFYAPMPAGPAARPIEHTGSLFAQRYSSSLYSDTRARFEGDIITVVLRERTQASKNARTETQRDSSSQIDPIVGFGGRQLNTIQLGTNSTNDFKGDAKSNQSNSLTGDITVNVVEVQPNGNLVIRGEKWLQLNTGKEFIRLTGIIRQEDVDLNNTVESTKIANARIEYSGTGAHHGGQSPGWLTRFFSSPAWPF